MNKPSSSGFALGTILLIIVLLAALTTALAILNRSSLFNDRTTIDRNELLPVRDAMLQVVAGTRRVIGMCPTDPVEYSACLDRINVNPICPACATDENAARYWVFHPLYGGGGISLPVSPQYLAQPLVPATWYMARQVSATQGGAVIPVVVYLEGLSGTACRLINEIVSLRRVDGNFAAPALQSFGALPFNAQEGCFAVAGAGGMRYQYFYVVGGRP